MLLAALRDLFLSDGLGIVTKRQAIDYIAQRRWFALHADDFEPYPSQRQLSNEPRWHTLIAWARKDSVLRELITYTDWNSWGLTRVGRDAFEQCRDLCQKGTQQVAPCFLWSSEFKRFMCPGHVPGPADARRPRSLYRDIFQPPEKFYAAARDMIKNGTWSRFRAEYRELLGEHYGNWVPRAQSEMDVERLARMLSEYLEAKQWRDVP